MIPLRRRLGLRTACVLALLSVTWHLPDARADGPAAAPAAAPPVPPATPPAPASAPAAPSAPPAESPPPLAFPQDGVIQKPDGKILFFYRTNFVSAKELLTSLTQLLPVPGVTLKDFQQNVLLIDGLPDDVELAVQAAAYFDVSKPQVFIEAKVIEITYESNFEFGLDYLWNRDKAGPDTLFRGADAILSPPAYIGSQLPGGLPFQGTSLLFGFVAKTAGHYGLADLSLEAMQLEGKAEVLSKPSIICTQGVPADVTTQEVRQVNIFERADLTNTSYKASTLNTGVHLTVTATHIGESFVTLDINPQVQGVEGLSATTGGTLQPVQTTRSAKTTVTLGDGETLVIGGLYTNLNVRDKAKTPLLSEIPLLGQLFTRTNETKVKTELVFMLTPTIVRKTSEFHIITPPSELERLEEKEDGAPAKPPCPCPTPPAESGPPVVRPTPGAPRSTPVPPPPPPPPPPEATPR